MNFRQESKTFSFTQTLMPAIRQKFLTKKQTAESIEPSDKKTKSLCKMFRKKVKTKRTSNSYVNIISKKLSLLKPFNYFILIKLFYHNYAQTVMKKPFLRIAAIKNTLPTIH